MKIDGGSFFSFVCPYGARVDGSWQDVHKCGSVFLKYYSHGGMTIFREW